jgi:transposase
MYSVDIYNRVHRACLKDGMSAREVARYFNKDRKTIAKMLRHALPPGYRRSEAPRRPTLDDYVGVINEILRTDKALIKKQRYTAKRIFERLRDEHWYAGSLTTVTYYVREQKRRTKEVFVKGYPAETIEAFCDGHVSAFAFFGGIPQSIFYDNAKIAVARILGDKTRISSFDTLRGLSKFGASM